MLRLGRRLAGWWRRQSVHGASTSEILIGLPRHLGSKSSDLALQAVNRALTSRRQDEYGAQVREALGRCGERPFFLVVVPGILHYAIPCLELAAPHVPVVLVVNGARPWEEAVLRERFPELPRVHLRPAAGSMLPHGSVLDVLLRQADRDFGLLDPDLYVFRPEIFDRLRPASGEVAVGAFGFRNRRSGLRFATTHLLAIDVGAVQEIMARHRIGPQIYRKTPRHLVEPLRGIGIGDRNFPKEYLDVYDPLNLIMATALAVGLKIRVLDAADEEVFHVGGVSYFREGTASSYLTLRLLEAEWAGPFADRYRRDLVGSLSLDEARERLTRAAGPEYVDRIERLLERLIDPRPR